MSYELLLVRSDAGNTPIDGSKGFVMETRPTFGFTPVEFLEPGGGGDGCTI